MAKLSLIISIQRRIVLVLKKLKELYNRLIELKKKGAKPRKETPVEIIRRVAAEEKTDIDLAVRVAKCESALNPRAKNVNAKGTIDRGIFQWNDYWHPEISDECAYDVECATKAFCKAVKEGHLFWWNASRTCWSK